MNPPLNRLRESFDRFRRRARFAWALHQFGRDPQAGVRNARLMQRLQDDWLNPEWCASAAYLRHAVERAISARGPILECGSGLSTILMGVATRAAHRPLVALENDPYWAQRTRKWLRYMRARHVTVIDAPLVSFADYDWYAVPPGAIPDGLALAICDGPPGTTRGGRTGLLPRVINQLRDDAVILLDDASRPNEVATIASWAAEYGIVATLQHDEKPFAVLHGAHRPITIQSSAP